MRITLRQLAAFEAIARAGSIVRAAEEIGLSQSAASMSLKELESHLGEQLFDRQGGRLALTPRGRQIREMATSILVQVADLESMKSKELRGHLRIGAAPPIGNYILPRLCAEFMKQHAGLRMELKVAPSIQVMDGVAKMSLDIGFVGAPVNSRYLEATPWLRDSLVVCCAPDNPLTSRGPIPLAALKDHGWVLEKTESSERVSFIVETLKHMSSINIVLEADSIAAIKRVVMHSDMITCVSNIVVADELQRGELKVLDVPELEFTRIFSIIGRRDVYDSHVSRAFREFAIERCGAEIGEV